MLKRGCRGTDLFVICFFLVQKDHNNPKGVFFYAEKGLEFFKIVEFLDFFFFCLFDGFVLNIFVWNEIKASKSLSFNFIHNFYLFCSLFFGH